MKLEENKTLHFDRRCFGGMTGKHHSKKSKQMIGYANSGKRHYLFGKCISAHIKLKMSRSRSSYWNNMSHFKEIIEKRNRKISNSLKGNKSYWYGKHLSEETKMKMRKSHEGQVSWCKGLTKENNASLMKRSKLYKGRRLSEETKRKLSEARSGEKHPNWLGGKSFEPYGFAFNNVLRETIRKRDNYKCKECGLNQECMKKKLDVHHIDYDKKHNSADNLISLCFPCHSKTNFNRVDWSLHFSCMVIK
jgi:hypothetical protein